MLMLKILPLFIILTGFSIAQATEITLRSDTWCPYACDPKSDRPGFMIEIAKEVFEKAGHKIKYEVMNWPRAVADVKSGKYDGLAGCSKADVEGFVIPNVPTGIMTSYVYTLKNEKWSFQNKDSLQNKKIGVINDYTYGDEIDHLVKSKHNSFKMVSGEDPLLRLIQMTTSRRIDGFVENPLVLNYTMKKLNKDMDVFRVASRDLANDPELFIAFAPTNPKSKEYAKILDAGMNELRKNGRLKVILAKYGLDDWKK